LKKNRDDNNQLALAGTEEAEILNRLGERVERAVATIQELRRERDQLKARVEELEGVQGEHEKFARERSEIRDRIEGILSSLEALEE
jgi:FtsZ-binding cell division protein ZapB